MMTISGYVSWFDDVIAVTRNVYLLVPADKLDWKPTELSFTLGQLIEHMPRALSFNAKVIASDEWPLRSLREIFVANRRHPSATAEEALEHLDSAASGFKEAVLSIGEERFRNDSVNTPQWGSCPFGGLLSLCWNITSIIRWSCI